MYNTEEEGFLTKKRIRIIILIAIAFLVLIIGLIIHHFRTHLSIANFSEVESSMSSADRARIEDRLFGIIAMAGLDPNADDIKIREGSYEEETSGGVTTGTFIVDIDSLRQTYVITAEWSSDKDVIHTDDVYIMCPKLDQIIYEGSTCEALESSSSDLAYYLPYFLTMEDGTDIQVSANYRDPNNPYIEVLVQTACGDKELAERAKEYTINWVRDTVHIDPDNYTFEAPYYICRTAHGD